MDYMGWYIIIIAVGFFLFKYGRTTWSIILNIGYIIKSIMHKSFSCNPKSELAVAPESIKALSVGLIIAEQNLFYTNSLETGLNKFIQKERLASSWGVVSEETTLERLNSNGDTYLQQDNAILHLLGQYTGDDLTAEELSSDIDLDEIIDFFMKNSLAKNQKEMDDILQRGTAAWHFGRLTFIARAGYACGYITKEQAWHYIDSIYQQIKKKFESWEQFGQSYMLGRAIWSSNDMAIDGLVDIYKEVTSQENSPWLQYPL